MKKIDTQITNLVRLCTNGQLRAIAEHFRQQAEERQDEARRAQRQASRFRSALSPLDPNWDFYGPQVEGTEAVADELRKKSADCFAKSLNALALNSSICN